jgi:hypothetical protein
VLRILLTSLLLALAGVTSAADDNWDFGKQAFENGDYAAALTFFETARDDGLDGPAVRYNIGVSQFKLGHYRAAGQTFSLIAHLFPKMRGLAEYNLGLVARRLGEKTEARGHFLQAYKYSPEDRTIRILASRRLRELEPDVRTASRWTGAFGARIGNDDNVALRDEAGLPAGTTTDSAMVDVFAAVQGPWSGRSGVRFDASAYLIKYFDAGDFDQAEVAGGVFYDWRLDDWRIQAGVHVSAGSLGGEAFDRKTGAHARALRYFGGNSVVDLRYTYDDVTDSNSLFSGIAGSRQQIDARYRWYSDGHRVQLRYWLEFNDRVDPGVSPDRNRIAVGYRYQPEEGVGYEADIDVRNSDYDQLTSTREEDLLIFRAALTYTFRNRWEVLLEYRSSDNDSSDDTFSYDRSQITLGALKLF